MTIVKSTQVKEKYEITITYFLDENELQEIADNNLSTARKLMKYYFGEKVPLKLFLDIRNFFSNEQ